MTLVKRGTARRLGLRDPEYQRKLAELITSGPTYAEVLVESERLVVDAIQRKRVQHGQAWEALFNLARINWPVDPDRTDSPETRVWVAGYRGESLTEQQEGT